MQGSRGTRNIAINYEELENRSAKLQGRQREDDEREKSYKFSSASKIKSVARPIQECLKERVTRQVS
jgi:hypothetical protein